MFPYVRMRRLRKKDSLLEMLSETLVHPKDLIAPIFVIPGNEKKEEIKSMPGVYRISPDLCAKEAKELYDLGIRSIILFGIPESKDPRGESSLKDDGVVQVALKEISEKVPEITLITDICLCEYTDHGHCGVLDNKGRVINDSTLEILAKQAISHAKYGADIVAPSGMMDGMVFAIREALDEEGYEDVGIMSYSAKFFSSFYGPFRDAAESSPSFGDRRNYQMNFRNPREALREVELDVVENADIVMVKPALSYLDIIYRVSQQFELPVAAYNVSGEYSMIKFAAKEGLIDGKKAMVEVLTAIKRAGADLIITYFAKEYAKFYRESQ